MAPAKAADPANSGRLRHSSKVTLPKKRPPASSAEAPAQERRPERIDGRARTTMRAPNCALAIPDSPR